MRLSTTNLEFLNLAQSLHVAIILRYSIQTDLVSHDPLACARHCLPRVVVESDLKQKPKRDKGRRGEKRPRDWRRGGKREVQQRDEQLTTRQSRRPSRTSGARVEVYRKAPLPIDGLVRSGFLFFHGFSLVDSPLGSPLANAMTPAGGRHHWLPPVDLPDEVWRGTGGALHVVCNALGFGESQPVRWGS